MVMPPMSLWNVEKQKRVKIRRIFLQFTLGSLEESSPM